VNRFPDEAPGQEAVLQLLSQLYFANLLHYENAADSAQLFERFKKRRQREMSAKLAEDYDVPCVFPLLESGPVSRAHAARGGPPAQPRAGRSCGFIVVGLGVKVVVDNFPALKGPGPGNSRTRAIAVGSNLALVLIKPSTNSVDATFAENSSGECPCDGRAC